MSGAHVTLEISATTQQNQHRGEPMLTALTSTIEPTPIMMATNTATNIVVYLLLAAAIGFALVGATLVPRKPDATQRHDLYGHCMASATIFVTVAFGTRIIAWTAGADLEPFALGQTAWLMLGLAASLTAVNAMSWYLSLPLPGAHPAQDNNIQPRPQDPR